jgi:alpha-N-arabinofuranosidase
MVDWVAYCNATEGKFAELRKQNGHPEPFNVKFWSVGNERYDKAYIHRVRDGAKAMKRIDPNVRVTCAGSQGGMRKVGFEVSSYLLETAGEHLDYISVHNYWLRREHHLPRYDYMTAITKSEYPEAYIALVRESLDKAGLRGRLKIAFDEWNLRAWQHPGFPRNKVEDFKDPEIVELVERRIKGNDLADQYTMADALFAASFLNACLRHSEDVTMANIAPIVNTRGPLFVHPRGIVKRTHYHAMAMYTNLLQERIGSLSVKADKLTHGKDSVAVVDAIATVDKLGKSWAIALVNRHPSDALACTVKMKDTLLDGEYDATVLTGESADSYNDIEHPNRVVPKKTKLTFKKGVVNLSPHSLVIVHVPAQSVEDSTAMDTNTVKQWSAPYRNWHYYPDHVIGAKPNIKGFENVKMTDVPTVFQLPGDKKWYMTFIGFDGKGYQSFIAESDDLVHWTNMRLAMGYGPEGSFDYGGVVLGAYLYKDYNIKAPRTLKKKDGEYFSLYGAYPRQGGYELRPGYEGVASSKDGLTWQRAKDEPILSVHQKDCGAWEKDCIYQPWLVEHKGKYYNFYNAADGHIEQMGLALSDDILEWKRYEHNPVIPNGPKDSYNEKFSSDGKVFWDKDHWVNFFFGVGKGGAHVMVAFSRDLYHWTVDPEPIYKAGGNPSGLDKKYAHKISLVWNPANETYYMYYNAVGNKGRGIGLITSKPLVDVSTKQQGLSYQ